MATIIVAEQKTAQPTGALAAPIRVSEIISTLSFALDLTEGQPIGHSIRSCVFGMHLAKEIGLPLDEQGDLYYALLMKDAGCSTNASKMFQILGTDDIRAKRDVKTTDWTKVGWESLEYALAHVRTGAPFLERVRTLFDLAVNHKKNSQEMVQIRCERGAAIARRIGLSEATASAIHSLDELWNGAGHPQGLRGKQIPLLARILNLAQTVDVFYSAYDAAAAVKVAKERSGRWFDPDLVKAAESLAHSGALWTGLADENLVQKVASLEPKHRQMTVTEDSIDRICMAFAEVIDAKSPFTYRHSNGVADAAVEIGQWFGMNPRSLKMLRRAALLHDIGKLSVPNSVLEKPAKLTSDEWTVVKSHPYYTFEILKKIPGFERLSQDAAAHHEKLDGSGYWRGWGAEQLSRFARILAVADIFDALHAKRPYRDGIPLEKVFQMLRDDAPRALDLPCVEALIASKTNSEPLAFSQPEIAVTT